LRNREVILENQRLKYKIERVQASMPYLESLKVKMMSLFTHKLINKQLHKDSNLNNWK